MNHGRIIETAQEVLAEHGHYSTREYAFTGPGPGSTYLDVDIGNDSKLNYDVMSDLMDAGLGIRAIMSYGHRKHQHPTSPLITGEDEPDHWVRLWFGEVEAEPSI